ncbi:hypothetical protein M8C21_023917 [Ambrosia artemisiifolia]|uniref:Uncharacterized protein n=1 Tax=Ambrosia artemisiifolia TaxID=4212 RepID=A0AAD5D6A6_AMBAR|nr:hypothetical protein M8C21_023917 [Ambrosia artemisiifolia]
MESSSIATYTPRTSKKRVFPGSSSSCAEPDVIEITPPLTDQSSKSKARVVQKEVVFHEIIDVDMDDDCDDVLFIGEKGESNKKMKGISLGSCSASKLDATKVESNKKGKEVPNSFKSFNPNSNNYFDLDNYVFGDDYLRLQSDFDNIDLPTGIEAPVPWLQSHFDNIDLPTGMEAPVPWLQDSVQMKQMTTGNPFVISNAVLEASGSQPNRVGELSTSTWHPSSNNVLAQNMYSNHAQTGNSNHLSNNYNAKVAVNSPNTSSSRSSFCNDTGKSVFFTDE